MVLRAILTAELVIPVILLRHVFGSFARWLLLLLVFFAEDFLAVFLADDVDGRFLAEVEAFFVFDRFSSGFSVIDCVIGMHLIRCYLSNINAPDNGSAKSFLMVAFKHL